MLRRSSLVLVCNTELVYNASNFFFIHQCAAMFVKKSKVHILYHKELAYARILEFILISSCNFFELLFTSIYDLNTNVNSWRHNFIWLYCKIWWKNQTLFLNQFLRESRNKTRKNCFRYLKLMSPLNAAICTTISYTLW
jgi:hypothetical protein